MDLAEVMDEIQEYKKRALWSHSTGYNEMCFACPLLFDGCRGSKSIRWVNCVKRKAYEEKHGKE